MNMKVCLFIKIWPTLAEPVIFKAKWSVGFATGRAEQGRAEQGRAGRQTGQAVRQACIFCSWSVFKITTTTFFVSTYYGRFDFGTSLFQPLVGCPTRRNFTSQVELESTYSVNSYLPNITVG